MKTRPAIKKDSGRLVCRHTALEPIDVRDRGDGYLLLIRAKCTNCGAVLHADNRSAA